MDSSRGRRSTGTVLLYLYLPPLLLLALLLLLRAAPTSASSAAAAAAFTADPLAQAQAQAQAATYNTRPPSRLAFYPRCGVGGRCRPKQLRRRRQVAAASTATASDASETITATSSPRLHARGSRRYDDDDDDDGGIDGYYSGGGGGGERRGGGGGGGGRGSGRGAAKSKKKKKKGSSSASYEDEEDQAWGQIWGEEGGDDAEGDEGGGVAAVEGDLAATADATTTGTAADFTARANDALTNLQTSVSALIEERRWDPSQLDDEKDGLSGVSSSSDSDSDSDVIPPMDHETPPRLSSPPWRRYQSELRSAVSLVGRNLIEREEEARLVVLGMVTGEHVLLIGPPGTGKSALGRRLSSLCGGSFFQRLLTRFTTPEEIFGPLSLRALENDEYRRCTAGFLPTASVAFLDEIFKANSAILNTLLTILNERKFDNGAGVREDCPVRCVVGASNELPDSDELDALYDRFLLRKQVLPVSDFGLIRLLSLPSPGDDGDASASSDPGGGEDRACELIFADGLDRVSESLSRAAHSVGMGDDTCNFLRDLRTYMHDELDVEVSDRRLVKAGRLLRISAATHGRTVVDPIDCLLLQHIVWRLPQERGAVREWLWENLTPGGGSGRDGEVGQFRFLLDGLRRESMSAVRATGGGVTGASGARPADVAAISSLGEEVGRLASLLQERADSLARHSELLRRATDHLWLDPDEAAAAQQLLLPRAKAASDEVGRTLADARALEFALSEGGASAPTDEVRLSVIEMLWLEEERETTFTEEELSMGMKEAKAKFDPDTFRAWKRARKKAKIGIL